MGKLEIMKLREDYKKLKGKDFTRPLAILHRKGRVLTPAMKKFIETLGLDLPEARNV